MLIHLPNLAKSWCCHSTIYFSNISPSENSIPIQSYTHSQWVFISSWTFVLAAKIFKSNIPSPFQTCQSLLTSSATACTRATEAGPTGISHLLFFPPLPISETAQPKHPFTMTISWWISSAPQTQHRPVPCQIRCPYFTGSKASSSGQRLGPEKLICPLRVHCIFSEKLSGFTIRFLRHSFCCQLILFLSRTNQTVEQYILFVCLFILYHPFLIDCNLYEVRGHTGFISFWYPLNSTVCRSMGGEIICWMISKGSNLTSLSAGTRRPSDQYVQQSLTSPLPWQNDDNVSFWFSWAVWQLI